MNNNIEHMCAYMDAHHLLRLAKDKTVLAMLTPEEVTELLDLVLSKTTQVDYDKLLYFVTTDSLLDELAGREVSVSEMLDTEDICEAITPYNVRDVAYYLTFCMPEQKANLLEWIEFYSSETPKAQRPSHNSEKAKATDIESEIPQPITQNKQLTGGFTADKQAFTRTYTEPKSYYKWSEESEQILKECVGMLVGVAREWLNNEPTEAAIISRAYALGLKVKKGVIRAN
jgi:hypothetical protein